MREKILELNIKLHGWLWPLLMIPLWIILYINLQAIADFFVDDVFGMKAQTHLTETIRFFIFEVPKVMLLLVLIIFFVGILRTYFSPERTRKALEGKSLFTGNVMAAVLGIVTPFCSCSAIPLFLGFVEAGIPLGVTFSFLIAAPMINEVALVLLAGLFGWKVALIYVFTGLTIAIVAGFVLEKLKLQKYVADWVYEMKAKQALALDDEKPNFQQRVNAGYIAVKEIVGKIWLYIIIGIAVGAGAHGYVPDDYLAEVLGCQNWYSVPLAILVGIPLYSNAAGIIPIVSVLIEKGVTLGTALAFMMSVIGLSLPEIIILKKVLKWQLIAVFIAVVAIGIILVGFIFNYFVFIN
ncbi:MAG: permease [Bacteroidetes bacterium]|nr:permease [Bacteroidota bacterium]